MTQLFKVGDRVRTRESKKEFLLHGAYTGTVVKISKTSGVIRVLRDDGIKGVSADGSWTTTWEWLEPEEATKAKDGGKSSKHVAGVDGEAIDWAAHKEFGRGM